MARRRGSKRVQSQARKLIARELSPDAWLVTGGELEHRVMVDDDLYICDCGKQKNAKGHWCSHVLCVYFAKILPIRVGTDIFQERLIQSI